MKNETQPAESGTSDVPPPPSAIEEGQVFAVVPQPDQADDFDNSVFPHFWLCVPVALMLCWQFYDLFGARLFFYRAGASGAYGAVDLIGPAWLLMPLLFAALLFFAFWNMRFAREAGDTKSQSLRRGILTMGATFLIAAFIVWLLVVNMNWK